MTAIDDFDVPSRVPGLRGAVCPSAVLGAVRTTVVYPIDRVCRRGTAAHVVEECVKAVAPSVADGDSSATVERKTSVSWIQAPLFDSHPPTVFRAPAHAVCAVAVPEVFGAFASARGGVAGPETGFSDPSILSAGARAFYEPAVPVSAKTTLGVGCSGESSEDLPGGDRLAMCHAEGNSMINLKALYHVGDRAPYQAGGHVLRGLVIRRHAESELFEGIA